MTLAELRPGQQASIISVGGVGALRRRLLDMGLTPGTRLEMGQSAPSGDPLCLRIRSFDLSLRKSDADCIEITEPCLPSIVCSSCPGCGQVSQSRKRHRRQGRRAR